MSNLTLNPGSSLRTSVETLDAGQITNRIVNFRKESPPLWTNYFLQEITGNETAFCSPGSMVILKPEFHFYRLYFLANDLIELSTLLRHLPAGEIYLELLFKNEADPRLTGCISSYFRHAATYAKKYKLLSCSATPPDLPPSKVNSAEIHSRMYDTFNLYYDHLASLEDVRNLHAGNNIISIVDSNKLCSFAIIKRKGRTAYLNHIANYGAKKHLLNLWRKLYVVLDHFQINKLELWYDLENKKAENMYTIEQFLPYKLYNYIYKKI